MNVLPVKQFFPKMTCQIFVYPYNCPSSLHRKWFTTNTWIAGHDKKIWHWLNEKVHKPDPWECDVLLRSHRRGGVVFLDRWARLVFNYSTFRFCLRREPWADEEHSTWYTIVIFFGGGRESVTVKRKTPKYGAE